MPQGRDPYFQKVSIIGVGLIGASFAMALKALSLAGSIVGCGRNPENLHRARRRGIIDDYRTDIPSACEGADLVLLATPVGAFIRIVRQIAGCMKKGAILSDVGSVKGDLVAEIEDLLPPDIHYVPLHPIAGGETSGIDEARADLFRDARCIITPTMRTDERALEVVQGAWERMGARVELMDPYVHDRIYAVVSHFPHIAAYALVNILGDIEPRFIEYAGRGFRDTTRIALSSPELWRDICMQNRENISDLLLRYIERLAEIEVMIGLGNAKMLEAEFARARDLRSKLT